jgi:predicted nucleotidyltransferase
MKIVGIITEYNPLHNGHLYHINKVKEISNCDVLVCVLSGNYVMRGNLSCIDKYNKTKFALQSGIDLVIEIPFYYVNNSSDIFAYGAVSLLNKIGVEEIYFVVKQTISIIYIKYIIKLNH